MIFTVDLVMDGKHVECLSDDDLEKELIRLVWIVMDVFERK